VSSQILKSFEIYDPYLFTSFHLTLDPRGIPTQYPLSSFSEVFIQDTPLIEVTYTINFLNRVSWFAKKKNRVSYTFQVWTENHQRFIHEFRIEEKTWIKLHLVPLVYIWQFDNSYIELIHWAHQIKHEFSDTQFIHWAHTWIKHEFSDTQFHKQRYQYGRYQYSYTIFINRGKIRSFIHCRAPKSYHRRHRGKRGRGGLTRGSARLHEQRRRRSSTERRRRGSSSMRERRQSGSSSTRERRRRGAPSSSTRERRRRGAPSSSTRKRRRQLLHVNTAATGIAEASRKKLGCPGSWLEPGEKIVAIYSHRPLVPVLSTNRD
jgi:hypothetical protein